MTLEELVFLAVVLAVGLPAGFRNPTAIALSASWGLSEAVYYLTGEGMAIRTMFLADMTVIGVIYCKREWRDCFPYRTLLAQLEAAWRERSPWDRAILCIFPATWIFYTGWFDARLTYWALYGLAMAQIILAGVEALQPWLGRMANTLHAEPPDIPTGLAWSYGGDG